VQTKFTVFDEIEAHRWCSFQCGDEGHIPQDPAIALLWIAFVHTREKGVHVASTPRIIELLDNLFVFFQFCRHFLLPPYLFIGYFLESSASRSGCC
jgi:hypothetical protein